MLSPSERSGRLDTSCEVLVEIAHQQGGRRVPDAPKDDRRKCLLVTHARTLFSVFAADVHAADIRPIGRFIVPLIERELEVEGLPTDIFGSLSSDGLIVTKTADRSVLGCMNDISFVCESFVSVYGGLRRSESLS